jgi:hypothetical protein
MIDDFKTQFLKEKKSLDFGKRSFGKENRYGQLNSKKN